jgi:phosphate transport system permease protein
VTATTTSPARGTRPPSASLTAGQLNRPQRIAVVVGALVVGALTWIPTGAVNWARWAIVSLLVYCIGMYVASRIVEGHRHAVDRLATALVTSAFILVLLPLVSVVWTVIQRGAARFDADFFTSSMRGVISEGGGAWHAIVGTLIITSITAIISIPFGLLTAIYLVEYGGKSRLAASITSMVDVMTGIPSIVAGLFAFSLFAIWQGPGARSGLSGAVALTVLMTPVVIRSAEEMLRLVPNELREASYALGVPKWKTIVKVVLPTSIAGILTGITLAISRVIGETAPLLVTAGIAAQTNLNPFSGRMATLPVYTYYQYAQPGVPPQNGLDRAWTGALTLMIIVAILFTIARVLARILKPKGLR